jgi:hypothetical protein
MTHIEVAWDTPEHNTILNIYHHDWTWDDFAAASQESESMMDSVDTRVDFILDVHDADLPSDILGHLPSLVRSALTITHPDSGYMVLVGTSKKLQVIDSLIRKVYPDVGQRFCRVETMEEARCLLADRRAREAAETQRTMDQPISPIHSETIQP